MKQVDSHLYDKEYYENAYGQSVLSGDGTYFQTGHLTIFSEMADLLRLQPSDKIVDYGCGNGDLAFFLVSRYGCDCTGIDYSKSAIDICQEKLRMIPQHQGRMRFINTNNDYKHNFTNIKAVYLADVVEHMYDPEIELILSQIKGWGENVHIVVHTDNTFYLNTIRPVFDFIHIVLGIRTWKEVREANRHDRSLHVNLTNPYRLRHLMHKNGFEEVFFKYPTLNKETLVRNQLGKLQNIPFIISFSLAALKIFDFLSPTFYSLYKKS
ncbi:MAG: methyltransferase domain-containing protein [Candidatus Moranbacteria bacterium]|nr:methyltransferase domain-containing protein [Candidatus Moranbacteria bacterium]